MRQFHVNARRIVTDRASHSGVVLTDAPRRGLRGSVATILAVGVIGGTLDPAFVERARGHSTARFPATRNPTD